MEQEVTAAVATTLHVHLDWWDDKRGSWVGREDITVTLDGVPEPLDVWVREVAATDELREFQLAGQSLYAWQVLDHAGGPVKGGEFWTDSLAQPLTPHPQDAL